MTPVHFFLQLSVILLSCRLVGVVAKRLGQPQVVAEMVAGVLLGPSLFGLVLPDVQSWLFPWNPSSNENTSYLFPVAQLGLALYMFVIGMEFRIDIVTEHLKSAVAVAVAGMVAPLVLGAGLAWAFVSGTELFPASTGLFEAMLFLGASMCVTAFPVLARIVHAKGLSGTTTGTVALGAGAIGDTAAWGLLAIVLAGADDSWQQAGLDIASGVAYALATLFVVKPLLARAKYRAIKNGELTEFGFVVGVTLMALGAWFTDRIGLHAVFGAFMMGAAMPRGVVARDSIARIQPLCVALLLPLFFTYSGLNTRIGLLNTGYLWLICGAVFIVAVLGKGVACWLAARATGLSTRESAGIGALMNARGLMELIMINIGLERGIISAELFVVLVIMAIVTTLMASPVLDRLQLAGAAPQAADAGWDRAKVVPAG